MAVTIQFPLVTATSMPTERDVMSEEKKPTIKVIEHAPDAEDIQRQFDAMDNPDTETVRRYICEVCGIEEDLTEAEALDGGWDYPPFIGMWGVLSPRTCGDCDIEGTAYWHVLTQGTADLPEKHLATIKRVLAERPPATDG